MNKIDKIFQKGQSLVEVIIALVVITIILTSLSKAIIHALKNVEYSRNENYSLHLAQTKMEEIRIERDSLSWGDFWDKYLSTSLPTPILENLNSSGNTPVGNETVYEREVQFRDQSIATQPKTKMEVIIKVSWTDSSSKHTIPVSGYFTKWN